MPGAVWHSVEGAGHFVAVASADDVFAVAGKELGAEGERTVEDAYSTVMPASRTIVS